jgi:hypothetical protein
VWRRDDDLYALLVDSLLLVRSFSELVDVAPLPFELSLLLFHLPLSLSLLDFPILHLVADQAAAERAQSSANQGSGSGAPDRRADQSSAAGAEHAAC